MEEHPRLPKATDTVKWYHHILALPLRMMSALNVGPLGGDNSISAVIETVLIEKQGQTIDFKLSKSDRFFADLFARDDAPDEMIEYRELSHAAQLEIIHRWGDQRLGIIWIGAGVFTLTHPLLAERKQEDWHIWTDASPKVVASALKIFNEMRAKDKSGGFSYEVTLPQEVQKLNEMIRFLASYVSHIVIFGYGTSYVLTMEENYAWLSRLERPDGVNISFVFNSPGRRLPLLPGIMAAFHKQRMVYYERSDIEALFEAALPGCEIVWEKPKEQTRNKVWETWLITSVWKQRPGH
jgi:hypothetical protein